MAGKREIAIHVVNLLTNLVPRLSPLCEDAEERPWLRLVTCHANKLSPEGARGSIILHFSTFEKQYSFVSNCNMADYIAFLCCLEFALLNSLYQEVILKPKQVLCLESVYLKNDVMCVLPTGYGKSLIFHLLPLLLFAKYKLRGDLLGWRSKSFSTAAVNGIVIVVSPLNSLISDQISRLQMSGIRASVVNVKEPETEFSSDEESDTTDDTADCDPNVNIDFSLCEEQKLRVGHYQIVFAHPETLVSSKYGRGLLLSKTYQENVSAIVVDEAHCIVEWLVLIFL